VSLSRRVARSPYDGGMARLRTTMLLAATAALAATGLAGCGEEDAAPAAEPTAAASTSTSPSASTKAAPEPEDCQDVWGGRKLPRSYPGCLRNGELVKAAKLFCSSGQVIVTFDDRYYAVPGGPVNDVGTLKKSKQFQQASRSCSA